MKYILTITVLCGMLCGCTVTNLRRHSLNQSMSVVDMRYQQVVDNLAVVCHNQGELPSFALLGSGIVTVANTYGLDAKTSWNATGLTGQLLTFSGKHNPSPQWTIDPVADSVLLQGVRAACLWVVCDGLLDDAEILDLLGSVSDDEVYDTLVYDEENSSTQHTPSTEPRPHFDVLESLQQLPSGWFRCGTRHDVPKCTRYCGSHCGTYVWVTDQGMAGLSEFTLILADIATRDTKMLNASPATISIELQICSKTSDDKSGQSGDDRPTRTQLQQWKIAKVLSKDQPTRYAALNGVSKPSNNLIGTAYYLPSVKPPVDCEILGTLPYLYGRQMPVRDASEKHYKGPRAVSSSMGESFSPSFTGHGSMGFRGR